MKRALVACLTLWAIWETSALADEGADRKIAESALREAGEIISSELFGHYDLTHLAVLKSEEVPGCVSLGQDYGLVKATLEFSAKRNTTKHPTLNRSMFEPGSAMCQDWLYLHCGVPVGHAFEGRLEVLLAVGRGGSWRAVSPIGAQEYSIRSTATYSWTDGKRKDMCCFPNSGAPATRSTGHAASPRAG